MNKKWSEDEIDYLKEYWGTINFVTLRKNLNRTTVAIKRKAYKLGLPPYLHSSEEYITFNKLFKAMNGKSYDSRRVKSWIKDRNFPISYKKTKKRKTRIVYFDKFWEWAEINRTFVNFAKLEKYALGYEPNWVDEQRKADILYSQYKNTEWNDFEDKMLMSLLKLYKYTSKELSDRLKRTEDAIAKRIIILGIKERPIKAESEDWTKEEEELLKSLVEKGYRPVVISKYINKITYEIKYKIKRMVKNGTLKKTETNVVFS